MRVWCQVSEFVVWNLELRCEVVELGAESGLWGCACAPVVPSYGTRFVSWVVWGEVGRI